jgi:hypothetical protein
MVHLQRFHETYGAKGLQVFVISMHHEAAEARTFTRDLKVTYPVLDGHDSDLGRRYAYG